MHFEVDITVNRQIDTVFQFASDLERVPEWSRLAIEREKLTEGPIGVGSRYRAVDQLPGRRVEFFEEVTSYEPTDRASFAMEEPLNGEVDVRFQALEDATRIDFSVALRPKGLMGVIAPFLTRPIRKTFEQDLANLKGMLEAS